MESRISMITLGTANLERSVSFYEKGLKLKRKPFKGNIAFFSLAGTWLSIYPQELLAKDATVEPDGTGFRGVTLSHNVNSPEEVEIVLKQAVAAGATLVKKAAKADWGGFSGYFSDPDGHLWEVAHNPFEWIGPPSEKN